MRRAAPGGLTPHMTCSNVLGHQAAPHTAAQRAAPTHNCTAGWLQLQPPAHWVPGGLQGRAGGRDGPLQRILLRRLLLHHAVAVKHLQWGRSGRGVAYEV